LAISGTIQEINPNQTLIHAAMVLNTRWAVVVVLVWPDTLQHDKQHHKCTYEGIDHESTHLSIQPVEALFPSRYPGHQLTQLSLENTCPVIELVLQHHDEYKTHHPHTTECKCCNESCHQDEQALSSRHQDLPCKVYIQASTCNQANVVQKKPQHFLSHCFLASITTKFGSKNCPNFFLAMCLSGKHSSHHLP
jgi:hypothetical protein